jgi:Polyketide cyclase / dehydrase and lipid transport
MARIDGEIVIGRPVDVVSGYIADQSKEPQYNPQMVRAEKITAGPVGRGTRFRSAVAVRGRTAEMLIQCTSYDRPRLFATTTMAQASISHALRFGPVATGTRMRWSGQVRPKGSHLAGRPARRLAGQAPGAADLGGPERASGSLGSRGRRRRGEHGHSRAGVGARARGPRPNVNNGIEQT